MKTIAFLLSHPSHQIATFNLAKKLIDHNYEVIYIGPEYGADNEDLVHIVTNNGFTFKELDIYHSTETVENENVLNTNERLHRFISNLADIKIYKDFFEKNKIDLLVLDIFLAPIVIPLSVLNMPLVLASTIILSDQDKCVAPLDQFFVPDVSTKCKSEIEYKWQFYLSGKKHTFGAYAQLLKKIAELHHFDFDRYFYWEKSIVPFGFDYPELIFWDMAFDFPRSADKIENKYFLGNQVYMNIRYEQSIHIDPSFQKMIYVSLGTKEDTSTKVKASFYHKIMCIAERHQDILFILSVPNAFINSVSSQDQLNLQLHHYCPQIEILRHATLMITHGGGSVKECLRMGVPTLCYPIDNDQHGNAARIVYHELGIVGNIHQDSESTIEAHILNVLNNESIKENIKYFQQRAITAEESKGDIRVIERFLS